MTELNNEVMKTQVETFLTEETVELIYDNEKLEKWNDLVGELGLKGQKNLAKPEKSPIPFMHMKDSLVAIFETLCPAKVDASSYDVTPIPVEILDLILLSKKEGYFSKIEIWYDDKNPDPCCVGYEKYVRIDNSEGSPQDQYGLFATENEANKFIEENNLLNHKPYGYSWTAKKYLIGKWADVKKSIKELREDAKERFMSEEKIRLLSDIKKAQRDLDDLELSTEQKFN